MASGPCFPSERAFLCSTLSLYSASLQDASDVATQLEVKVENGEAGQAGGEVLRFQTNLEGVDC